MCLALFLYLTNSQSKQVVRKNIEICFPNLSKVQQQDLIKKSLIETGISSDKGESTTDNTNTTNNTTITNNTTDNTQECMSDNLAPTS
jgi:lauroyl/myristoyl acyltransferase